MGRFTPRMSLALGDLISSGASGAGAGVQAGASGSGSSASRTVAASLAASTRATVPAAPGASNATGVASILRAILDAAGAAASSAGGSAGAWISYFAGNATGTATRPPTEITEGDLNTATDWLSGISVAVPLALAGVQIAMLAGKSGAELTRTQTEFSTANTFLSEYLTRIRTALVNARAQLRAAKLAEQANATPDPIVPPPSTDTGSGMTSSSSSSDATMYIIPVGLAAVAALIYFMKR